MTTIASTTVSGRRMLLIYAHPPDVALVLAAQRAFQDGDQVRCLEVLDYA